MNALGNYLLSLLSENKGYFLEMDYLSSFILKLTNRNDTVKTWFVKNGESLRWVLGWINENPKPPLTSGPGMIKFRKRQGNNTMLYSGISLKLY